MIKKLLLPILFLLMSTALFAQTTTYQLGTETCSAVGHYPVASAYQFNCNGIPVLNVNGSVQLSNSGHWIQVHVPGVAEPNQYLLSKFYPTEFSTPTPTAPGTVAYSYQITDESGSVFHGTLSFPWVNYKDIRGWYYPRIVATPSNGTLTLEPGPLS